MINTSQDPDYFGPTGHEKRFYKTHFHVLRTLKKSDKPSDYEWVEFAPGKFRRVKKEQQWQHNNPQQS